MIRIVTQKPHEVSFLSKIQLISTVNRYLQLDLKCCYFACKNENLDLNLQHNIRPKGGQNFVIRAASCNSAYISFKPNSKSA